MTQSFWLLRACFREARLDGARDIAAKQRLQLQRPCRSGGRVGSNNGLCLGNRRVEAGNFDLYAYIPLSII